MPAGAMVQKVEPVTRLYEPTGHAKQLDIEDTNGVVENVPAGQMNDGAMQTVEPTLGAVNPALHAVHSVAPATSEYVLIGQLKHDIELDDSVLEENMPAGQLETGLIDVQMEDPAEDVVYAGHPKQSTEPVYSAYE